jgi:acyl-CoA synthetase (AMP-forming)/AMP-acid ligase II
MCGKKMVMPGARMDGESLFELIESEQVTLSAGVPTIWMMLLAYMKESGKKLTSMQRTVIGGAAAPKAMIEAFERDYVATIDSDGYMQITDRSKDVINSGGEWISSIALENEAVGCPAVAQAAVIAVSHPKWDERPLLLVVKDKGSAVTKDDIIGHLRGTIAKWQLPDDVIFKDELPHTATGKLLKTKLRADYKDYKLPTAKD